MTKAARAVVEKHNREVHRRNLALVKRLQVSEPKKSGPSRATKQLLKQCADDAQRAVVHDRGRINANSRNQRMPRLCPRW